MRKKTKLLVLFVLLATIGTSIIFFMKINRKEECNNNYASVNEELININECTEEFMNNYFEKTKELNEKNNKDNILIVSSKDKIKNTYGATDIVEAPNNQYILQYDSEKERKDAYEKLKKDNSIISVDRNIIYQTADANYNSWGIQEMKLDYATNVLNDNTGHSKEVTVAVIDTVCEMELFNKYYGGKIVETYNVLDNSKNMIDTNGHGTHVVGTIAEGTPDNVKILPIKASENGNFYDTDIITAINYITYKEKADVINMSFGSYEKSEAIEQAIKAANQKNIISIAASGNENTNKEHYPSALKETISIASVDAELKKSSFSNYGDTITFVAPGTNIKSIMSDKTSIANKNNWINPDGDSEHETMSGTSMATPHAVAAVAILKSYNKNLTEENVIELLKEKAIDLGEEGWDQYYGYGFISFNNVEFCDKPICDDTCNVYKELNDDDFKIELSELKITKYNYYSPTNLMESKFKITKMNGLTEIIKLGEIQNAEILNYNPTSKEKQEVIIKIGNTNIKLNVVNPENFESGWEYDVINQREVQITGYKQHNLDIKRLYIPETIEDKNIIFSNDMKFEEYSDDFSKYEYVYLPEGFTKINDYLFANTNIKYVYGNSTGVEVGNHAFESSSIISFRVPITIIGNSAFKNCDELLEVNITGQLQYVTGDNREISYSSIGEEAFYNCKKLKENIKSKYDTIYAKKIGKKAFANCVSLAVLKIYPAKEIEEYAFYNTSSLCDFDISKNLSSVGSYAFYNSGIQKVYCDYITENIGESAFENCKYLKEVTIKGKIGKRAFWNSGIEDITFANVPYISEDAFAYTNIVNCNTFTDDDSNYYTSSGGIIEKSTNKLIVGEVNIVFSIPDYITEIGNYAFTGNANLKQIMIPANIKKIGKYTFKDCSQLTDVYILGNNVEIGNEAFKINNENDKLCIYIYKDSNLKEYIANNNIKYGHINPDKYEILNIKKQYVSGQSVSEIYDEISVKLTYNENEVREEIIKVNDYTSGPISSGNLLFIKSQNQNGKLNYGDTYIMITVKNHLGYEVCTDEKIPIKVVKATPSYSIPKDLTAKEGQLLSEIKLPEGFEWMDENQVVEYSENTVYKAKYVPKDIENYEIIENIEIPIKVKRNVNVEYEYNEQTNQVIAKIVSDVELKNTKPTWKLSEDKKSYTKVFSQNQKYSTTVQNINGQIYEVDIVVDQIQKTDIKIQEIYNEEENEVTIQLISNTELKNTKPTWKLSEDKKMYTKTFTSNTKYNTLVEDKWGNIINTNVEVTKIKSLEIQIDYELIKETNQVKAIITSNVKLKNTKPTWKLSEDQKTYTKIYNENSGYMTKIESINGECKDVEIKVKDIDDKGPEIILDYVYNNTDNTVIVYMKSNEEMQDTKPTWKLSEDKMTYEKVYPAEEQNYYTEVKDIYGNSTNVKIQFKYKFEDIKLGENKIKLTYLFTANNEVNVQVISDNEFEDTKPTWNLSENKKVYSKVFYNNQNYSTKFKMVDGNEFNINIIIDYFK